MLTTAGRLFAVALVVSLLMQMQIAENGYAARGAKIAFSSTRNGNSKIYIMDGDGGNQVRLTDDPAWDHEPSWSPDGDRIAFSRNSNIHVMDSNVIDGWVLMNLTGMSSGWEPAWSPDGAKIAFTRFKAAQQQVWVMDADGQNQILLTHVGANSSPAWSPDGKRIAFSSTRVVGSDIYVMDENGDNQVRLTQDKGLEDNPSWSPGGQWIAYDSFTRSLVHEIHVVKTDGSGLTRRLTRGRPHKRCPAWSPDGRTIAYVASKDLDPDKRKEIHLMTADGDYLKQLSKNRIGDTDPDWFDPVERSVSPAANFVTIWGEIKKPTSARR